MEHLVKSLIFSGYISPNLGLTNEVFENKETTVMGELYMSIKGKRIRKNMLERVPPHEIWGMMAEAHTKPEMGFTLVTKRATTNTFTAIWDEEEEDDEGEDSYEAHLDNDANQAWLESKEEAKTENAARATAAELSKKMKNQTQPKDQESEKRTSDPMEDDTVSNGAKRKAGEVENEENDTE